MGLIREGGRAEVVTTSEVKDEGLGLGLELTEAGVTGMIILSCFNRMV